VVGMSPVNQVSEDTGTQWMRSTRYGSQLVLSDAMGKSPRDLSIQRVLPELYFQHSQRRPGGSAIRRGLSGLADPAYQYFATTHDRRASSAICHAPVIRKCAAAPYGGHWWAQERDPGHH
jgi:hypothetical protein